MSTLACWELYYLHAVEPPVRTCFHISPCFHCRSPVRVWTDPEEPMALPLDGTALHAYTRRLGLPRETHDLLATIRSSPPQRTPSSRHGNVAVWYPSRKMHCVIKAESHKVEFAFVLTAEHDEDVLEYWDQPPAIPLDYRDAHGHRQQPWHTADFFVFRYDSAGWVECKPTAELQRQARTRPDRYVLDEQGVWQCPPGGAFAGQHGLTYRVWAADQINWIAQDNWQFLEDYYQEQERLQVPDADLAALWHIVDEQPGILLTDLQRAAASVTADAINAAIATHALYVDLATYRLSEPARTPFYRTRANARVSTAPSVVANDAAGATPAGPAAIRSPISPAGQTALAQASDADLATAIFRNRVIHPDQYDDDEQARLAVQRAAVPARTLFRWKRQYRDAEARDGSGLLGLLPHYHHCRGRQRLVPAARALIAEALSTHYDTATRKPVRGAYGEYLRQCAERGLAPASQRTFYTETQRYKTRYEQAVAREGTRAAYPFKEYSRETAATIPRHGAYAWSMAHLDHTELDLLLCDSRTGQLLGRCWLSVLILSQPRRIAACYLTFDPPSYRSCLMVLRLCVRRFGRLPTAITVDGGSEFQSIYFEQLLALYRVRKHQRPAAEPRFGSVQERLFGTLDTEFIQHLLGNTQALRQPRLLTRASDPSQQAVWTLPALAARVQQWADEEYDTLRHPALGMSPREAYTLSIERDGARAHRRIAYDETFLMATLPSTRNGAALVQPGVGVRVHHLDYWCEAMRDPRVERTAVKVRYDPFDMGTAYVYLDGRWRRCVTVYQEFAGCSERELQQLSEELRQRHRLQTSRAHTEVRQQQLAAFRRDNAGIETILRQQRRDRETRAALTVLEGSKDDSTPQQPAAIDQSALPAGAPGRARPGVPYEQLLVLPRIQL
jgi:putative transposase